MRVGREPVSVLVFVFVLVFVIVFFFVPESVGIGGSLFERGVFGDVVAEEGVV